MVTLPLRTVSNCRSRSCAQNAVDVDGGQAQRIGEHELAERAFELGFVASPIKRQPFGQLHEEMRRALDGVAPADVDQVLDHHGFVA